MTFAILLLTTLILTDNLPQDTNLSLGNGGNDDLGIKYRRK
jgi:hypothetical protein